MMQKEQLYITFNILQLQTALDSDFKNIEFCVGNFSLQCIKDQETITFNSDICNAPLLH